MARPPHDLHTVRIVPKAKVTCLHCFIFVFLQIALRVADAADVTDLLGGCDSALLGSAHHEELRVVGGTLFHCDLAEQTVLSR
jgi:hypothetical protein